MAQTDLLADLDSVDHIELDRMVGDKRFHLSGQMFLDAFHIPGTVQKERAAVH